MTGFEKTASFDQTEYNVIHLLLHSYDYITADEIAEKCGISLRSLRSRMNGIRKRIEACGCTLDAVRSRGYKIPDSQGKFHLKEALSREGPARISYEGNRTDAIIRTLMLNDDHYCTMDWLADTLYVSRSTVKNELNQVNAVLAEKNLRVEAKARCGLRLRGTEMNKRRLAVEHTAASLHRTGELYMFLDLFMNEENIPEHQIIETLRKGGIRLSDLSLADVLLYLSAANQRMKEGKFIREKRDIAPLSEDVYNTAAEIMLAMSRYWGYPVRPEETAGLAWFIHSRLPFVQSGADTEEAGRILDRTAELFYEKYRLRMEPYFLRGKMLTAIRDTLVQLRGHGSLHKLTTRQIRKEYPFSYQLAVTTAAAFQEVAGLTFTGNSFFYFTTLYRNELMHRHLPPRRALLVCGYGPTAAENVRFLLERSICFLKIADTCMYSEINEKNLSAYDLIISTIPICRRFPIPAVNISPFVSRDDLDEVREKAILTRKGDFVPQIYFHPELFLTVPSGYRLTDAVKLEARTLTEIMGTDNAEEILSASLADAEVLPSGIAFIHCRELSRPLPLFFGFAAPDPLFLHGEMAYLFIFFVDGKYEGKITAHAVSLLRSLKAGEVKQYAVTNPDYPHLLDLIHAAEMKREV